MMTISRARLQAIEAMRDEEIDYSDIPATDEAFWSQATLHRPASEPGLYIPLDQDLLDWLQRSGPGYQTRITAICVPTWNRIHPRRINNAGQGREFQGQ